MKIILFPIIFVLLAFSALAIEPVFWNTLDNDTEVANSRIGVGGTPSTSLTYLPAMFKNGADDIGASKTINFPQSFTFDALALEMWINWTTDGYTSLAYIGDATNGFYWYKYNDGKMYFDWAEGATWTSYEVSFPITAGELEHIAVMINGSESDTNRIKMFRNGTDLGATPRSDFPITTTSYSNIKLGYSGAYDGVIMDNIKLFNYSKTNFSDRIYENGTAPVSPPPQTFNITATAGIEWIKIKW